MLTFRHRAFGIDNRVVRLNYAIDRRHDWPEPYLLSKLIRCIAYPLKRCWLVTKKIIFSLAVLVHICVPSHMGHTGDDVEMGESVRGKGHEASKETSSESLAEHEFRKSLQTTFSEVAQVDRIMSDIKNLRFDM